jgi:hypothetical protein
MSFTAESSFYIWKSLGYSAADEKAHAARGAAARTEVAMRAIVVALGLLLMGAGSALAGEIYGSITEDGRSVGAGVAVEIRCGDKAHPAVETDKSGAYHLAIEEKGKCTLTVRYKGESPSVEIASYDEGVQVDLVLERKDGKYVVRRK